MNRILLILLVFVCQPLFAQQFDAWDNVLQTAKKYLVNIEYYEEIDSPESIRNGNKIKKSFVF